MTLLETLLADLEKALGWNQNSEVAPVCLLWPDEDRLFESAFQLLAAHDPRFYSLGEWNEQARRGPAVWLRWKLDSGQMSDPATGGAPPICYLPGVARAGLRPEESVADELKPLCELLFRGRAWAHENGKDQTPLAWLLGHDVDIAGDAPTREALARALPKLWPMSFDALRGRGTLRAGDFDEILHPEPIENLLSWMNDAAAFESACGSAAWKAFVSMAKTRWNLSIAKDGPLGAAEKLAGGAPEWEAVWKSFERSATRFEGVTTLLERLRPSATQVQGSLFDEEKRLRYPSLCAANEAILRGSLDALAGQSAGEARAQIAELNSLGGIWRTSLWAKIGRAPLALALEKLLDLGQRTEQPPMGTSPHEMAQNWATEGWKTDALVWETLALGPMESDFAALKSATRALYGDWLDAAARLFAERVNAQGAAAMSSSGGESPLPKAASHTTHLFADGLRLDLAHKLRERLEKLGFHCDLDWRFGALPGVTPTAKPAATPLDSALLRGGEKLSAAWADGRKVTADNLRGELEKAGFTILHGLETGNPKISGKAWLECGNFDSMGHGFGAGLALQLDAEINNLASRIAALLRSGWGTVEVITDHGWLMLPGGLPKAHLPEHLTEIRKGRCARLKTGQSSEFQSVPWHWDESVEIAVAPGARCFEEGREYEHGGLSLQECVVPVLRVMGDKKMEAAGQILEARWRGLRLRTKTQGGHSLDLRKSQADEASSICGGAKTVSSTGETSLVVEDDSLVGLAAHLVLLDYSGEILHKLLVTVGE